MKRCLFALAALLTFSLVLLPPAGAAPLSRLEIIGKVPNATGLQFSPDGRWLLATSLVGLSTEGEDLTVFDLSKQKPARKLEANFAEFSPDSRSLVLVDMLSSQLRIVDLQSGKIDQRWDGLTPQNDEYIQDVQLQKNGRELVAATQFRIWRLDVQTGAKVSQTKIAIQHREAAGCGMMGGGYLLKDGRRMLYLNADEAWIYDVRSGKRRGKAELGLLTPDEKWQWFYNPEVGQFSISDFATGKISWGREFSYQPQFSGDGKTLIVIDEKTGVRLLAPRTGEFIRKIKVPLPRADDNGTNATYALSPDNNYWFVRQGDEIVRYRLR